jgi:hypothetical protein
MAFYPLALQYLPLTGGTVAGLLTLNGGTATAGSAPVLTPAFANGTAAQLSDHTRDYMVYLECTTAGTALVVAIGPTSSPANTIFPVAGTFLFGGGQLIIKAGDRLQFAAETVTGNVTLSIGLIEIDEPWLGEYLL